MLWDSRHMPKSPSSINGFPPAHTVAMLGITRGKPRDKRKKVAESYRRAFKNLVTQVSTGVNPEDTPEHAILKNRLARAEQLGKPCLGVQRETKDDIYRLVLALGFDDGPLRGGVRDEPSGEPLIGYDIAEDARYADRAEDMIAHLDRDYA